MSAGATNQSVMQKYRKIVAILVISFLLGAVGHIVPYSIHSKLPIDWMLGHMLHIVGSVMVPVIAIPWVFMRIKDRQASCWWFAVLIASGLFLYFATYCEMGIDVKWYAQRGQNIVRSSCVGCGICAAVCPRGVLRLENGDDNSDRKGLQAIYISRDEVKIIS